MLFRSMKSLLTVWNQSNDTDTPRAISCVMPVLYCSTYGRVRFGSGLASDTVPKFDGRLAKLISQEASVVKLHPLTPWAMSSWFLSVQGRVAVIPVLLAGSYRLASVVVAAAS